MWILALGGIFAILEWIAVSRDSQKLEFIAKPATLLLLSIWFAVQTSGIDSPMRWLYLMGLLLSLVGDTLLMFPQERLRQGVIAFLFAHVAYVLALNSGGMIINLRSLAIAIGLAIMLIAFLRPILAGIYRTGKDEMRIPVIIYAVILGATTWSVLTTFLRTDWILIDAILVSGGGLLFLGSDIGWAFNQFARSRPDGRVIQLAAYHIGQFLMAIGIWHHLTTLA
jgi:uncharacterized membrane protein YhhN